MQLLYYCHLLVAGCVAMVIFHVLHLWTITTILCYYYFSYTNTALSFSIFSVGLMPQSGALPTNHPDPDPDSICRIFSQYITVYESV